MKKGYALPLILLVSVFTGAAFGEGGSNTGTASLTFLKISPSARGIALGDAYVGVADDAGALFYNPAGLTLMGRKGEASVTWMPHPAGATFGSGQVVVPGYIGGGKLGFGVTLLTTDDMPEATTEGLTGLNFRTSEWAAFGVYAMDLTDKFSAGMTFKYIVSNLAELSDADFGTSTWCVDIGTVYKTGFRGLKLGMSIANFGARPKYHAWENKLPMNFRVGTSLELVDDLVASFEFNHPNDNIETYHCGMEYTIFELLSLRSGFKYMEENYWWASGLGVKLFKQKLNLDYAYQSFKLYPYMPFHYVTMRYMF